MHELIPIQCNPYTFCIKLTFTTYSRFYPGSKGLYVYSSNYEDKPRACLIMGILRRSCA